MDITTLGEIGILVITAIGSSYTAYIATKERKKAIQDREKIDRLLAMNKSIEPQQAKVISGSNTVITKKQKFLRLTAIDFIYANEAQITNLHNCVMSQRFTTDTIATEQTKELSVNAKAGIDIKAVANVGAEGGGKNSIKVTTTEKSLPTSPNAMFLNYQREMINRDQVILGLEDVDNDIDSVDNGDLNELNQLVEILNTKFKCGVNEQQVVQKRSELTTKAIASTRLKLEQADDFVLIEGKFEINAEDDLYKCVYTHPISDLLTNEIIHIVFHLDKSSIVDNYKITFQNLVGRKTPLKVYGRVASALSPTPGTLTSTPIHKELSITPIAIY